MGQRGPIGSLFARGRASCITDQAHGLPPLGEAPEWLKPDQAALYRETADNLAAAGVALTALDRAVLCGFVTSIVLGREAEQIVRKEGLVLTTKRRVKRIHPAVRIADRAWSMALVLAKEIGLTPAARARLGIILPSAAAGAKERDFFGAI